MQVPQSVSSSDGTTISVHDLGGVGPTLVLCHATGFCGPVWQAVADGLTDRFHVVAPDLRGHGHSARSPDGSFTWEEFADDVLAVVDGLSGGGPIVAAGHSKGAAALLLAEIARPGTFAALWCYEPIVFPVDPPIGPLGDEFPLVSGALRRRDRFASIDEARANFTSKPPMSSFDPGSVEGYLSGGLRPDGVGVTLCCRPADEAQVYRMGSAHGAFGRLDQITCPVVVACGADTDAIRPDHAATLAARMPHARAEVIQAWGHFGPLEHPARAAVEIAAAVSAHV